MTLKYVAEGSRLTDLYNNWALFYSPASGVVLVKELTGDAVPQAGRDFQFVASGQSRKTKQDIWSMIAKSGCG